MRFFADIFPEIAVHALCFGKQEFAVGGIRPVFFLLWLSGDKISRDRRRKPQKREDQAKDLIQNALSRQREKHRARGRAGEEGKRAGEEVFSRAVGLRGGAPLQKTAVRNAHTPQRAKRRVERGIGSLRQKHKRKRGLSRRAGKCAGDARSVDLARVQRRKKQIRQKYR